MAVKKKSPPLSKPKPAQPDKFAALQKLIRPVGEIKDPLTALFYGRASTGKTVVGATFPKPLLIVDIKERGTESIARTPGIDVIQVEDWTQIEDVFWFLKKGSKYISVTLDHLSQMQQLAITTLRTKLEMKPDDNLHKGQWGWVSGQMKEWIINYRDLRDIGMNVCMIAHDRQFGGEETEDNQIDPSIGPGLMPSVASFANGAVSIIGNTFIRERFERDPVNKAKKIRRVEYCMRVGPHASYVTKIRRPIQAETQLPDIIVNPSYDKLMKVARGEELRKPVKPLIKPVKK